MMLGVTDPGPDELQWGIAVAFMPERLRLDMARAACVLIADELIRGQVVDASRAWRSPPDHAPNSGPATPPSMDDPEFGRSLEWLADEAGLLTGDDVVEVWAIRRHATEVAASLGDLVLAGRVQLSVISSSARLLRKLGVFWARLDMDVQGVDHSGISDEDIRSGPSVFFEAVAAAVGEV